MDKFQNEIWNVIRKNADLSLAELIGVLEHIKFDLMQQLFNRPEQTQEETPKQNEKKTSPVK